MSDMAQSHETEMVELDDTAILGISGGTGGKCPPIRRPPFCKPRPICPPRPIRPPFRKPWILIC